MQGFSFSVLPKVTPKLKQGLRARILILQRFKLEVKFSLTREG